MLDERVLISQCKKGVRSAQKALFDRYKVQWYMICLRYASSKVMADEILELAVAQIFSNLGQYNGRGKKFSEWAAVFVIDQCIESVKREIDFYDVSRANMDKQKSTTRSYSGERISADHLTQLLQNLPLTQRLIYNLYAIDGYAIASICIRLDIPESMAGRLIRSAKKELKKHLEQILK